MIPGTTGAAESAATAKLIAVTRMRDVSLADHGVRTAHIAAGIASELGMTPDEVDRIYLGAMLHDIGKLGVPEAVLWKPEGLDRTEWRIVRSHPEDGHRLIADLVVREVAACVLYHHERVDGEGYPHGSDLGTLPISVRIVQVADAFDAMTSDRPYEPALPASAALAEITRCAGAQFDPEVAAALSRMLAHGVAGNTITLPTREEGPADPFALTIDLTATA